MKSSISLACQGFWNTLFVFIILEQRKEYNQLEDQDLQGAVSLFIVSAEKDNNALKSVKFNGSAR